MLLDQFADFMILVLLAAAVISGIVGDVKDTLAIVVIVVLNAVIGFVQEFRAERAMAALKQMAAGNARVVRGGETLTVPATELVPGDVVLLEAGNVVPADLRLVETAQLRMDEALLTGESVTVEKTCGALAAADLSLGDRRNIAFKGATATSGRGRGIVVATGMATELGRIAALLDAGESSRRLRCRSGCPCSAGGSGLPSSRSASSCSPSASSRGEPPLLLFLTAVSLAVAAIPEALPAVVTISLALGATKLAKQHALIRRLPAVETLGSVTCICSDKTGTLTQNRMRVVEIHCAGRRNARLEGRGGQRALAQPVHGARTVERREPRPPWPRDRRSDGDRALPRRGRRGIRQGGRSKRRRRASSSCRSIPSASA